MTDSYSAADVEFDHMDTGNDSDPDPDVHGIGRYRPSGEIEVDPGLSSVRMTTVGNGGYPGC